MELLLEKGAKDKTFLGNQFSPLHCSVWGSGVYLAEQFDAINYNSNDDDDDDNNNN